MDNTIAPQLSLELPPPLPLSLTQRIHDARYSGLLSECEHAILDLLVDHPGGPRAGKEKAISIAAMQAYWMRQGLHVFDDRSIKGSVKRLIEEHHIAIGSSRTCTAPGYYLAVSLSDLEAAERPLRGELISIAKRLRTFNPSSDFFRHLAGQLEIADPTKV